MKLKINILVHVLLATVLFYLAYKYMAIITYSIIPIDKVKLLNQATDNFTNIGFIICLISWVFTNVVIIKTKQLFWIFIPFLFTVFVCFVMSWQAEDIFIFNKQNGMWKGGFSLNYFLGAIIIFFAAVILMFNFFILKSKIKKSLQ